MAGRAHGRGTHSQRVSCLWAELCWISHYTWMQFIVNWILLWRNCLEDRLLCPGAESHCAAPKVVTEVNAIQKMDSIPKPLPVFLTKMKYLCPEILIQQSSVSICTSSFLPALCSPFTSRTTAYYGCRTISFRDIWHLSGCALGGPCYI